MHDITGRCNICQNWRVGLFTLRFHSYATYPLTNGVSSANLYNLSHNEWRSFRQLTTPDTLH
jgi:hypothetical protein